MSWQQWVAGPNGLVNGNNQVTKAGIYSLLKKLNIFFKIYKFSNQNLQTFFMVTTELCGRNPASNAALKKSDT